MTNLLFNPKELLSELASLEKLARPFLAPESFQPAELTGQLSSLVYSRKDGKYTLEIPEGRPLRTRISKGEFEPPEKKTTRPVYATISGKWEVVLGQHRHRDPDRPGRKAQKSYLVDLAGLASTEVTVFEWGSNARLANWKMDVAAPGAPGCFFHTFASDPGLPVPRHPNLFPTPMSAIGFTLGELFQGGWEQALFRDSDPAQHWRSIQRKRLLALLRWQQSEVARATTGAWLALKGARPPHRIFL